MSAPLSFGRKSMALAAASLLLVGCAAWDPDLKPGWEAYRAGNWGQAYRLWLHPALDGNSDAQYLIGKMFYDTRDYRQAAIWFRQAADAGDSSAQHYLTIMTENGFGVKEVEGQPWLREDD
ncbi:MAG: tetratricopeptide repeat protein [Magnetovibrionaceae bacterium]